MIRYEWDTWEDFLLSVNRYVGWCTALYLEIYSFETGGGEGEMLASPFLEKTFGSWETGFSYFFSVKGE